MLLCALLVEDSLLAEVNTLGPSSAAAAPSEYPQCVNVGMYVCELLYLYFSNVNFVQLESGKYHAEGGCRCSVHANHLHNCKILAILLPSRAGLVLLHRTGPGDVTLVTVTTLGGRQLPSTSLLVTQIKCLKVYRGKSMISRVHGVHLYQLSVYIMSSI